MRDLGACAPQAGEALAVAPPHPRTCTGTPFAVAEAKQRAPWAWLPFACTDVKARNRRCALLMPVMALNTPMSVALGSGDRSWANHGLAAVTLS
jgi:hypothetical protein